MTLAPIETTAVSIAAEMARELRDKAVPPADWNRIEKDWNSKVNTMLRVLAEGYPCCGGVCMFDIIYRMAPAGASEAKTQAVSIAVAWACRFLQTVPVQAYGNRIEIERLWWIYNRHPGWERC